MPGPPGQQRGHSEVLSTVTQRVPAGCFLPVVVINSITPPLSDSLSFMSHLLYSFIPTLRANLSGKIPAATSYPRFSFEENQINIPGMLNILLLFSP